MAIVIDDNAYYTAKEYATMRECKPSTLEAERSRGTGCPFIKDGAQVLYAGHAIREHWLSNQRLHGAAHKMAKVANSPAARQAAALADSLEARQARRLADTPEAKLARTATTPRARRSA